MKYYDHYILAQGGIHDITAFAVAFNFNFFLQADPIDFMRLLFAFDTCRFSYCSRFTCVHVIFSLCWLVGCTFTGLHGPRMLRIVGGPHNFSLVIPFI